MTNQVIRLASCLIRQFEGLRLNSYWDSFGKVWTIGYGHTANVVEGQTITVKEAEAFLVEDSKALFELVRTYPPIAQAALVSFGYNCGAGALRRVLKGEIEVKNGSFIVKDVNLPYGESAGGKVLPGLVTRRALEAALIEAARV